LKTDEEKGTRAKVEVPGLLPQSPEEHLEYGLAEKRKHFRMQREKRIQEICDQVAVPAGPAVSGGTAGRAGGDIGDQRRAAPQTVVAVDFTELVLPFSANHMGNTFGGQIMAWMVKGASAAVWLHLRRCGVSFSGDLPSGENPRESGVWLQLVAVDQIHFKSPSHVGDRVHIRSVLTRVFESSLEVLVQVSSAAVASQDAPNEINIGYLTYAVHKDRFDKGETLLKNAVADVRPETMEQQDEYRKALARQQFRLQRRETAPRPDSALSGLSVNFSANAGQAEELAVLCVSGVLRIMETSELRWEALPLPEFGNGIKAFADVGVKMHGAPARLKLTGTIRKKPQECFVMLQDVGKRKAWDMTCVEVRRLDSVGHDAELVQMVLAAPCPGRSASNATGEQREILLLRAWREDTSTGSYVVASRSVLDDSREPLTDNKRGELLPSGYIIVKTPGSGGESTDITFVGQFDHATFEFARPHVVQLFDRFRTVMEDQATLPVQSS